MESRCKNEIGSHFHMEGFVTGPILKQRYLHIEGVCKCPTCIFNITLFIIIIFILSLDSQMFYIRLHVNTVLSTLH